MLIYVNSVQRIEQLIAGLSSVQAVLGSSSGITEKEIKDALWYYYFDQEKTVAYLLEQQHKKSAAREKAETGKFVLLNHPPSHSLSLCRPSTRFETS
jgi:hypothetical protein